MLTLSQARVRGLPHMPSITNLMQDCVASPNITALSDAHLAFLRGVYKTQGSDSINLAISCILREMKPGKLGGQGANTTPVRFDCPDASSKNNPLPSQ